MIFRMANMQDLPALQSTYRAVIAQLNENKIHIWDERYPYEVFAEDIAKSRLYVLIDNEMIISAFALLDTSSGEKAVRWEKPSAQALYLYRFAVHPNYSGKGIGKLMLQKVREVSREKNAEYLRLFVVDCNLPALRFYEKDGFEQVNGTNIESINDGPELIEYGFEVRL